MLTARELYDRGVAHGNAGRHARAEQCLAQAARRTTDPDLAARIEGTRAYLSAETGDPQEALARCRAALATAGPSPHTRAVLVSQIGLVELRRGHVDAALEHLTAATAALADDPARLGRVLLNRGLAHLDQGDVAHAEDDFTEAATQLARSAEPVEQAKAQHNQGYAALVRGDLVGALRLMEQARGVLVALSPVALAVCDTDRAAVLRAAGESAEAAALLTDVVDVFRRRRLRQAQAEAELALADALLAVDPGAAAVSAARAARRFRERGNELGALRADACAVSGEVLALAAAPGGPSPPRGRRPGRAAATADRAEATARALAARGLGVEAAAVRLQAARLALLTGRLGDARARVRGARVPASAPIPVRLLASEVRAELAWAQGRRSRVLVHAATGVEELERWLRTFGSIDLQAGAAVRGRTLVLHGLRAAVADGDPRRVFEWSERARSLASRVVPLRPPPDPAVAARLTELRRLRLLGGGVPDARREADLRDAVRRRTWAREGAPGTGAGAAGAGAGALVTLDAVRAELAATGADLVAHVWSDGRLTALVVSDDVHVVDVGAWAPVGALLDGLLPDLDMAGADLPPAMAAAVRASLDERLAHLDALLVAPLRHLLRHGRLVLTPTAALARVPWEMLGSLAEVAVTRPTSAGRWLEQRAAVVGSGVVGSAGGGRAGFAAGPGVARAADEVRACAAGWPGARVLVGAAATAAAVADLAGSVDVLHVAAHGRHAVENPLFSAFELADGPWFGYDIDALDRVPAVVVLSACELGRSASAWGREALGMAQAWLHAGARCVVAAGASLNDDVACELLAAVHRELVAGVPAAEALRDASAALGARTPVAVHGTGW
ncbi:CHAT domain-containing protein [Cellulomonas phragmiteti]|uniref:CHAT domain-containing protein n=1 Tax=Cellulomonas phragmiteti TaxID=478780 RepID=A0ABQ4DIM3_9CELL|nr:CHAT domain-containing protein [Cellulomonas phragmiteti]GIG39194.1 CHAT domain-containing protein [Cellulomonas phragmiteti]